MLPALRNRKLSNISVGRKYQLTDKEVNIMSEIRRGDIWMVDFGVPEDENDHKLHGIRPVVIVSNDSANRHSTVFHAVPLTSKIHKKTYLPKVYEGGDIEIVLDCDDEYRKIVARAGELEKQQDTERLVV